jgi:RNA polymerase sigma factor (TIGR02999 family)
MMTASTPSGGKSPRAGTSDITLNLNAWRRGDQEALDAVMPVYGELRRLAASYMQQERSDHTLQTTALVHEAFLKLSRHHSIDWHSRAHFLAIAATVMRRILVDCARQRETVKRGGGWTSATLDEAVEVAVERAPQLVSLDEALTRLAALDPQQGKLVELRYFGGLSVGETAEVLGVTARTVKRRWRTARMWLYRYLTAGPADDN